MPILLIRMCLKWHVGKKVGNQVVRSIDGWTKKTIMNSKCNFCEGHVSPCFVSLPIFDCVFLGERLSYIHIRLGHEFVHVFMTFRRQADIINISAVMSAMEKAHRCETLGGRSSWCKRRFCAPKTWSPDIAQKGAKSIQKGIIAYNHI